MLRAEEEGKKDFRAKKMGMVLFSGPTNTLPAQSGL
jgi:hypothetical protein